MRTSRFHSSAARPERCFGLSGRPPWNRGLGFARVGRYRASLAGSAGRDIGPPNRAADRCEAGIRTQPRLNLAEGQALFPEPERLGSVHFESGLPLVSDSRKHGASDIPEACYGRPRKLALIARIQEKVQKV